MNKLNTALLVCNFSIYKSDAVCYNKACKRLLCDGVPIQENITGKIDVSIALQGFPVASFLSTRDKIPQTVVTQWFAGFFLSVWPACFTVLGSFKISDDQGGHIMPKNKMKNQSATVAEAFESFLNSRKAKGAAAATLKTYHYHFAALSHHMDMNSGIDTLTRRDIEDAIAHMRDSGISANSIRTYVITFRSFLSWCRAEGLTDVEISPYKGEETVKDTYTDAELKRLLKKPQTRSCTFAEFRNWTIVSLLVNSGCRAATIRNMKVADVKLSGAAITYRHKKNKNILITLLCSEMVSKGQIEMEAAGSGTGPLNTVSRGVGV